MHQHCLKYKKHSRIKEEQVPASLVAQLVKNLPVMQRPWFDSWVRTIPWRRDRLPTPVFMDSSPPPSGSDSKESTCNVDS